MQSATKIDVEAKGNGWLQVKGAELTGHVVVDAATGAEVGTISATGTTISLAAGLYHVKFGESWWKSVEVKAKDIPAAQMPLQVEVLDWRLPEPAGFQTLVGLEQNPYAVAKHYGVKLWSEEHLRLLAPSFQQLARIGAAWLNVPILRNTEFGNRDDSMVRWIRKADGSFDFDFAALDEYLALASRHIRPRVVMFAIMHGMPGDARGPGEVMVRDERTGRFDPRPQTFQRGGDRGQTRVEKHAR